jgi:hypothetical protein
LWPNKRDKIRNDLAVVVGCAGHGEDRPISILEFRALPFFPSEKLG